MGLLVAGLQLFVAWRYLAGLVEGFESRGVACLWDMWTIAVSAFIIGQIAKHWTPKPVEQDEELDFVLPEQCSSLGSFKGAKEGQELTVPREHFPAAGKGEVLLPGQQEHEEEDDEEDMATIKRRAQEEAAAKLAKYRAEVQQLLASIRKEAAGSSSSPVSSQLLYRLADQLFASSINLSEFVELGGVPVVVEAVRALTRSLAVAQQQPQQHSEIEEVEQPQQRQQALQAAALPAMLQATWVLLQLSQGPPACRSAVQDGQCSSALLAAAATVSALPPAAACAPEAVLRNIWWTLLAACDKPAAQGASQQHSVAALQRQDSSGARDGLLQLYQEQEAVSMLGQLVGLRHGLSAGWVAAAQLGLLIQLGHQQQQQQQAAGEAGDAGAVLPRLSEAAVQAVLQEDALTGLCYMMTHMRLEQQQPGPEQQQQQLSRRMRVLVEGMLHYLLTFHSAQLLQRLIELQLLGCFAAHSHGRLGRMLVCQLLSSKGQEVMAAVEEGYELDVALALAQIIPLKVHVKLAAPAPEPASAPAPAQQAAGEIEPAGAEVGPQQAQQQEQAHQEQQQRLQQVSDDLYTDILACRLLLQHQRLGELLSAFCEEVQSPLDPQQQQRQKLAASNPVAAAADAAAQECSVVTTGLQLVQHLMSWDLQLQAAQHVRGDCVSDSVSSSASSRSLEEALAMPDPSGTYSSIMAGMVPPERLPAAASSTSTSSSDLTLPVVQDSAGAAAPSAQRAGQVVFRFGQHEHAVDAATFKQIRRCSPLVSSILGRVRVQPQQQAEPVVVTVLAIPQFTDEANCWVLQCLERWLSTQALAGFSVLQAAKLWVAADFLQVDGLQVACEDVIAADCQADMQANVPVAVELCSRHVDSGGRLLRLLVQQLLKGISAACSSGGSTGSPSTQGAVSLQAAGAACEELQLLRGLLEHHTGLLLPVIHAELRDRLVTLCMLNAGQDAEDPLTVVG